MVNKHRVLFCDIHVKMQGHYMSYDQYLLDHIPDMEMLAPGIDIHFLFNKEGQQLLNIQSAGADRVTFIELDQDDSNSTRLASLGKIKKFALSHNIGHLILLDLDQYQAALFRTSFTCSISGILFRPHHRITSSNNHFKTKWRARIKRLKKKTAERLLIFNTALKNIFILNDPCGVDQLNRIHHTDKFKYLPDPVFHYDSQTRPNLPVVKKGDIMRFLIFGSISERKNISNTILAYSQAGLSMESELLIVGPGESQYVESQRREITQLFSPGNLHKRVLLINRYVSNTEMDEYFSSCDVCMLVYKDFFGSSGLLGRASLHGLKVIGPNAGLMQFLIEKYHMGLTADPDNVSAIRYCMERISEFDSPPSSAGKYHQVNSPEEFLKILSNHLRY